MISTDTPAIAITGNDPDTQFGARGLQPTGNGCSPSVNTVHAVGIHVIREAAAASDTTNHHNIFPGNSHGRHDFLNLCEDGIIAATRTPANLLIGGKIFGSKGNWRRSNVCAHNTFLVG